MVHIRRFGFAWVFTAVLLLGCGDDVADPDDSSITLTPPVQWVGGEVLVSGFGGTDPSLVTVRLDGEPVETRAADGGGVAFTVPNPGLSRTADVELILDERVAGVTSLEVVGAALATWRVDGTPRLASFDDPLRLTFHGAGGSDGMFVAPFNDASGNYVGVLNLRSPTEPPTRIDLLTSAEFPGLIAPGPAIAAGAWLVDVSPPDVAQAPIVLQVSPTIGATGTVDCVGGGILGGYAIAELGSGDCLVLENLEANTTSALSLNGLSSIAGYEAIPGAWSGGCVHFVSAAGGAWATLRNGSDEFDPCQQDNAPLPPDWPVFDADGELAFATERYPKWPVGVGFSEDELWTVGETTSGWAVDRWDPTSGSRTGHLSLDDYGPCADLSTAPSGARVYVACWLKGVEFPRDRWPALLVLDATGPMLEAVVETVIDGQALSPRPPYELVVDASAGRVHFVTVWDGTTAPIERGVMGASYDVRGEE